VQTRETADQLPSAPKAHAIRQVGCERETSTRRACETRRRVKKSTRPGDSCRAEVSRQRSPASQTSLRSTGEKGIEGKKRCRASTAPSRSWGGRGSLLLFGYIAKDFEENNKPGHYVALSGLDGTAFFRVVRAATEQQTEFPIRVSRSLRKRALQRGDMIMFGGISSRMCRNVLEINIL
jgi:hypothetical protein